MCIMLSDDLSYVAKIEGTTYTLYRVNGSRVTEITDARWLSNPELDTLLCSASQERNSFVFRPQHGAAYRLVPKLADAPFANLHPDVQEQIMRPAHAAGQQ
jgi:hypothetical protein